MKQAEAVLLALLRASLHGEKAAAPADADWGAVLEAADVHTVTALAAAALPEGLSEAQRAPWTAAEYTQYANYVCYLTEHDALCARFAAAGVPVVVLKGLAAAVYYPQPCRRAMGDIDLAVPSAHFARAQALLEEAGYTAVGENDRHVHYYRDGMDVELHRRFSYWDLDIEKHIAAGLSAPETREVDGHAFPMLPRLANGLVLLAHLRAHLRVGIGLRQVIDWMNFVERELDDGFWEREFCAAAREVGLDKLAVTVTRLCQRLLGLSERIRWCAGADEALQDALLDTVLASGNFGKKKGGQRVVGSVSLNIRREGLLPYLQRVGERDWKLLRRHRWLRPFAWLREAFVFLGRAGRYSKGPDSAFSEVVRSRRRLEMMKELNLL